MLIHRSSCYCHAKKSMNFLPPISIILILLKLSSQDCRQLEKCEGMVPIGDSGLRESQELSVNCSSANYSVFYDIGLEENPLVVFIYLNCGDYCVSCLQPASHLLIYWVGWASLSHFFLTSLYMQRMERLHAPQGKFSRPLSVDNNVTECSVSGCFEFERSPLFSFNNNGSCSLSK